VADHKVAGPAFVVLIGFFVVGMMPMAAYYAAIFVRWWQVSINSFMNLEFDPVANVVPGQGNPRRISLVVRNVHRTKKLSGVVLQLNYLHPQVLSLDVDGSARQFSHLKMQAEHSPHEGCNGIELRPGEPESFVCLNCRTDTGNLEVPSFSSQSGNLDTFHMPLVEYRVRFTAIADNVAPTTQEFDLRKLTDGTFTLTPIGTPSHALV
jgi:hypothetical protein